ncbi:MAG: mechanosensitive ion channel [Candidatus Lokiarchaeota archaeon]|nr:mechanosensitive ion channel [Candidatus Lokiarchaeota archaeon]
MVLFNSLFKNDLEATIYIGLIFVLILLINWIVSSILEKTLKSNAKIHITSVFFLKIIYVIILIYLIIEGFPIMKTIDPTYITILSTSISTAIAFASSGIFSNLISGIALIMIHSFDIGDIIKVKGDIGIIRNINLTRITIESFDNIIIEKSNSEILASSIINYSVKYDKIKKFDDFKRKMQYSELEEFEKEISNNNESKSEESRMKELFQSISKLGKSKKIHNFIFTMLYPYNKFHKKIQETEKLIKKYEETFGMRPVYHIFDLGLRIEVRFRILTQDAEKLFIYQPEFAKEIYQIIAM